MARGKYLSLDEAIKTDKIKQFCKEHPSEGDKEAFEDLLERMALNRPVAQNSGEGEQT